jgi:hypothetical protein
MNRTIWRSLAILAAALFTSAAQAEVKTYSRAGAWEAFGGTSNNGQRLCGVSTSGDGKYIGIKYYKGDSSLTIQLSNTTWKVTDGTKVAVTMKFDGQSPWRARATSYHMSDGDAALQFEIDEDQLDRWMAEFRQSYFLIIGFPNDKVDDWRANLRGTSAIADSMAECLRWMKTS